MTLTDEFETQNVLGGDVALTWFGSLHPFDVKGGLAGIGPNTPGAWTGATVEDFGQHFREWIEGHGSTAVSPIGSAAIVVIHGAPTGMVLGEGVHTGITATAISAKEAWESAETSYCLFRPGSATSTAIELVGLSVPEGAPESEFDEYYEVVDQLHNNGRALLAAELVELLRSIDEDPEDDVEIKLYSLQLMARFLVEHAEFADPLMGPDPEGTMQIEWRIFDDGLLVMAFLENEYIHCVAQAEPPGCDDVLDISVELPMVQAAEEYGNLVPRR